MVGGRYPGGEAKPSAVPDGPAVSSSVVKRALLPVLALRHPTRRLGQRLGRPAARATAKATACRCNCSSTCATAPPAAGRPEERAPTPDNSRKMSLVLTPAWHGINGMSMGHMGRIRRYQRDPGILTHLLRRQHALQAQLPFSPWPSRHGFL